MNEQGEREERNVRTRARTLNGGLDPAEMGRRSGQARRKKHAQREQEAAADLDPRAKRRAALERKAEGGDVYANRELREHHDYYYGGTGQDIWELLTREQRAIVRGWIEALPD